MVRQAANLANVDRHAVFINRVVIFIIENVFHLVENIGTANTKLFYFYGEFTYIIIEMDEQLEHRFNHTNKCTLIATVTVTSYQSTHNSACYSDVCFVISGYLFHIQVRYLYYNFR